MDPKACQDPSISRISAVRIAGLVKYSTKLPMLPNVAAKPSTPRPANTAAMPRLGVASTSAAPEVKKPHREARVGTKRIARQNETKATVSIANAHSMEARSGRKGKTPGHGRSNMTSAGTTTSLTRNSSIAQFRGHRYRSLVNLHSGNRTWMSE